MYRGMVTEIESENSYKVLVPEISESPILCRVCSVKGIHVQYEVDDTVFVEEVGDLEYVILGYLDIGKKSTATSINVNFIECSDGVISNKTAISNTNAEELYKIAYYFNTVLMGGKDA